MLASTEDRATDTVAARGQEEEEGDTSARTRSNSNNLTLTSRLEGGTEHSTHTSSSPPEKKVASPGPWATFNCSHLLNHYNRDTETEGQKKASKCINQDEYGRLGHKSVLIWQSRSLAET